MTEYLEKIRNLISNKCGVDKSEITPNSFFEDAGKKRKEERKTR